MLLDDIDRQILRILQQDCRIPITTLAEHVGFSPPATSARIRRLEEHGVIRGFTIDLKSSALNFCMQAIVRIRPAPGKIDAVQRLILSIQEFGECDAVTGDDCLVGRLYVSSIEQLDRILDRIGSIAETHTSIVTSQPIKRRPPPY